MVFEEAECVVRLSDIEIVLDPSSDVVQLPLVLLEGRQVFLNLLQCPPQGHKLRIIFGRRRGAG